MQLLADEARKLKDEIETKNLQKNIDEDEIQVTEISDLDSWKHKKLAKMLNDVIYELVQTVNID